MIIANTLTQQDIGRHVSVFQDSSGTVTFTKITQQKFFDVLLKINKFLSGNFRKSSCATTVLKNANITANVLLS